jgi:tetratricopeptide (TPR) repeat protein
LADAEYLRGHFRTAYERFIECVEVSRTHGFGRIEVANLPMITVTAEWLGEADRALAVGLEAIEAARRVGNARAELIAYDNVHFMYRARGEFALSRVYGDRALEIARRLGARRFEAEVLAFLGHLNFLEGDRAEAQKNAHAGLAILRETEAGMDFMGPALLGLVMLTTDDPEERQHAGEEAERLLAGGAVSHNHMYFRTFAIEACLDNENHDEAERHAAALANFCKEEGLYLIEFLAKRGLTLARVGRGENSSKLVAELESLIAEGERMHQEVLLSRLRHARDLLAA